MRRFLEPLYPLNRRVQVLEIRGCQHCVLVPIVSPNKEQNWDIAGGHRATQVQTKEFRVHRLKGYVVGMNEARDFPGCDKTGKDGSDQNPSPMGIFLKNSTITFDHSFHGQHLTTVFKRRRPNLLQARQDLIILASRRLVVDEIVFRLLRLQRSNQGIHPDESGPSLDVPACIAGLTPLPRSDPLGRSCSGPGSV